MKESILLLQLGSTWFMVGLIWFVQVVHYPLMSSVGNDSFPSFEQAHTRLTTFVVGPPMLIEAFSAVALLYFRPPQIPVHWVWIGFGLLMLVWIVTAVCSVPMHGKLEKAFDAQSHRFLVNSNWIRTIGWSARGILVGYFAYWMLKPTS